MSCDGHNIAIVDSHGKTVEWNGEDYVETGSAKGNSFISEFIDAKTLLFVGNFTRQIEAFMQCQWQKLLSFYLLPQIINPFFLTLIFHGRGLIGPAFFQTHTNNILDAPAVRVNFEELILI